jgi:hypothetical protein
VYLSHVGPEFGLVMLGYAFYAHVYSVPKVGLGR